ncbi:response regulator transcription factor [Varunaivibrio sulfuroxidans]|uniref:Two-component system OmpR family response regulator/two-component system torCAD operon response regulator TorR n=1 Tax=Varunaivibrio sulfuroxidans TaxID=1773489 RepID=A0A4R3JAQ2_9PROT|nr:response regulator transcription factor [Varunaivibrio sulfuroxidans]TCS62103.1 two-component system OmpR family response regulator/two-component system torCAD operon response regulator TorR [Varunaivibrio sulfuroxidans]WES30536.1 response regulator transcription factor [Varunaivibrio sulfuroxidans]
MTEPGAEMSRSILIVEDDEFVRALIALYLENAGYRVVQVGSGHDMFIALEKAPADLVLLDLNLPDEDGIVLARKLRARSGVPLMILTAREHSGDRIAGLEVGADDYVTKSVAPEEFLLRVRNLLARRAGAGASVPAASRAGKARMPLVFAGWLMDLDGFTLTAPDGRDVALTPGEFALLGALVRQSGRVLSRGQLLDALSGCDDGPSDRMIDAYISRIRKKIERDPKNPEFILTITGVGYKFNPHTQKTPSV